MILNRRQHQPVSRFLNWKNTPKKMSKRLHNFTTNSQIILSYLPAPLRTLPLPPRLGGERRRKEISRKYRSRLSPLRKFLRTSSHSRNLTRMLFRTNYRKVYHPRGRMTTVLFCSRIQYHRDIVSIEYRSPIKLNLDDKLMSYSQQAISNEPSHLSALACSS